MLCCCPATVKLLLLPLLYIIDCCCSALLVINVLWCKGCWPCVMVRFVELCCGSLLRLLCSGPNTEVAWCSTVLLWSSMLLQPRSTPRDRHCSRCRVVSCRVYREGNISYTTYTVEELSYLIHMR